MVDIKGPLMAGLLTLICFSTGCSASDRGSGAEHNALTRYDSIGESMVEENVVSRQPRSPALYGVEYLAGNWTYSNSCDSDHGFRLWPPNIESENGKLGRYTAPEEEGEWWIENGKLHINVRKEFLDDEMRPIKPHRLIKLYYQRIDQDHARLEDNNKAERWTMQRC